MERIPDVIRLQYFQREKLFGRSCREQRILFGGQCRHSPAGLTRNRNADSARCDHLTDFFHQNGGPVKVYVQDGFNRRLAGGDTRCVYEHCDIPEILSLIDKRENRLTGCEIHFSRDDIVACFVHSFRNGFRIGRVFVSDQNRLSVTHSACDGHTDLTGSC